MSESIKGKCYAVFECYCIEARLKLMTNKIYEHMSAWWHNSGSSHDDVSACIVKCDSAYKIGHMYTLNLLALKFKMLKLTMLLKFLNQARTYCMPGFLKLILCGSSVCVCVCVCVCVFVCMCVCPRG